jgi:maleylacetoacetate isomerase
MQRTTLPSSTPRLVLYSYWRSSSSFRVRFALELKRVPYEIVPVDLLKGEQSTPEHKARNPLGYVPCLFIDGVAFNESVAIIELLDDLFPAPPLYPREMYARARVRALVEAVNADTQPLQNRHVLLHVSEGLEGQKAWAKHFIARGLAAVEGMMEMNAREGTRGALAFGDALTAADLFLVPQVYNARRFGVDMAAYPRVLAAEQTAMQTDAAKAASPEAQRDAPPPK